MPNEEKIFELKAEDFSSTKKKPHVVTADEHATRLDALENQLSDSARMINERMRPCIEATRTISKLAEKMPEVLNLRQQLVDDKRFFEAKAARTAGILARSAAKLRSDFSTGGMKLHEQNAKLKGENSFLEEELGVLEAYIKFLEGSIKTMDGVYYQFRDKSSYEEKYKL
jgi:hypothetical protein